MDENAKKVTLPNPMQLALANAIMRMLVELGYDQLSASDFLLSMAVNIRMDAPLTGGSESDVVADMVRGVKEIFEFRAELIGERAFKAPAGEA